MEYKIGDIVQAKVTRIEKYGFFVLIDNDISGLVHISEISDSFVHSIKDYVDINEIIRVKIIGIEYGKKLKLQLSIKNIQYSERYFLDCPIQETTTGFSSLEKCLTNWIYEKKFELNSVICEKK